MSDLARYCDCSYQYIWKVMDGRASPSEKVMWKIAKALKVDATFVPPSKPRWILKFSALLFVTIFCLAGCCSPLRDSSVAASSLYQTLDIPSLVEHADNLDEDQKKRRLRAVLDLGTLLKSMGEE